MNLTVKQKAQLFDRLYSGYIAENGLGGMQKRDFDALFLWLIASMHDEFDPFWLSFELKVTETRVKSLLELAAVKYSCITRTEAWIALLGQASHTEVQQINRRPSSGHVVP